MKATPTDTTCEFTSESVGEGHPDKVCDFIADSLLDAHLEQDPQARTAIEVLCKGDTVILAGEITSRAQIDPVAVTREAIRQVGYSDSREVFSADSVHVMSLLSEQAQEIARAIGGANISPAELGAGDQGIMYGYTTDETPELMPLPILLAHRITRALSEDRKACQVDWLRPDAKAQVTVRYSNDRPQQVRSVLVSTQHLEGVPHSEIRRYVEEDLLPRALDSWHDPGMTVLVNPSGSFVEGGPSADCGLTGRKIIADTYGGIARHGGVAHSAARTRPRSTGPERTSAAMLRACWFAQGSAAGPK
jgi:S-adenosylmethionine synthetase